MRTIRNLGFALLAVWSLWGNVGDSWGAINVGERVQAIDAVNVRQSPAGTFVSTRRIGAQGLVVEGPVVARLNGFVLNWLRVDFDTGADGWVAEIGLASLSVIPPVPAETSPGALEAPGDLLPSGTVTLAWAAVPEAVSYEVRVTDAATGAAVAGTNTTALRYVFVPPPGRQLRWVVLGCNPTGCSAEPGGRFLQTPAATPSADGDNALFQSQDLQTYLLEGQTKVVTVAMENIGTTTWRAADGYFLGSVNPENNLTWGLNRVALGADVPPGGVGTFTFEITAPLTPGGYDFRWQLIREGVGFFGQVSRAITVAVLRRDARGDDAVFVSQVMPTLMATGGTFRASVTLRNTGTNVWSEAGRYRLSSVLPGDNRTWGLNRVLLKSSVAPGDLVTFSFVLTAPLVPEVYRAQWQMVREAVERFGEINPDTAVRVAEVGNLGDDAVFIGQELPAEMVAGSGALVAVTFRNAGTNVWPEGGLVRLGSDNPLDNLTWGFNRVTLGTAVAPGERVTVSFPITAPLVPGAYDFQTRMLRELVGHFGEASSNAVITVLAPPARGNAAEFVGQTVPERMTPGGVAVVEVTFRNTGTNVWSESTAYRLGSINPVDNFTWGGPRVLLTNDVAPGETYTFGFSIRAPAEAGRYDFQWMMLQEGVERFSDPSTNVVIEVAGEPTVAPEFTEQPVSVSVRTGRTASFRAGATGAPVPGLQWQRRLRGELEFTDLSGAVAPELVTPPLTLAEDGAEFRCVASNAAGVAVSAVATVTVTAPPVPVVLSFSPTNAARQVPVTAVVMVTFSEDMDPATITPATITIRRKHQTTNLLATVTYDALTRTATLRPTVNLKTDWTYFVTVVGGESGVKSLEGVALAQTVIFFYTPDTKPPRFSNVVVKDITSTGATITWTASENSDRQVLYGTTTAYGLATKVSNVKKRGHTAILTRLLPGTLYHFQIRGTDEWGNTGVSEDFTFRTLP